MQNSITVNVFRDPFGGICITDEDKTFCLTLTQSGKAPGGFTLSVDKLGVLKRPSSDKTKEHNTPVVATQKHQATMEIAIRAYGHARELGELSLLA
jgi:hypothetical protein